MNERVFHTHAADRLRNPQRVELLELDTVVATSAGDLPAGSVLDVGTGTGLFAEAFSGTGLTVTGIDINQTMLDAAARLVPKAAFKIGAAENIPYDDKSFDLVFFGHVLHETDDLVKALSEARRVAKKRIVILEWPYGEGPMGPPISHRLKPETIVAGAVAAGITEKIEVITMKHTVIYRINFETMPI